MSPRFSVKPSVWDDWHSDVWDREKAMSICACHTEEDAQRICALLNGDEAEQFISSIP